MKESKVQKINKITVRGNRKQPIIAAITNIKLYKSELYRELEKVLDIELWNEYSLQTKEE